MSDWKVESRIQMTAIVLRPSLDDAATASVAGQFPQAVRRGARSGWHHRVAGQRAATQLRIWRTSRMPPRSRWTWDTPTAE